MGLKLLSLASCAHTYAQDLFWPNRSLGWAVTNMHINQCADANIEEKIMYHQI